MKGSTAPCRVLRSYEVHEGVSEGDACGEFDRHVDEIVLRLEAPFVKQLAQRISGVASREMLQHECGGAIRLCGHRHANLETLEVQHVAILDST